MHKKLLLLINILIFIVSAVPSLEAYIYGYARLYREKSTMTIDLLYDVHVPNSLSQEDMKSMAISTIKRHVHQTERRVLEVLERLNTSSQARSIALVWEACPDFLPDDSSFIGYADRLVRQRLKHLKYIYADRSRPHLEVASQRGRTWFWESDSQHTFKGSSFDEPIHLCKGRIKKIIARSGQAVWNKLKTFQAQAVKRFKKYGLDEFREFTTKQRLEQKGFGRFDSLFPEDRNNFDAYWKHFLAFSALADVEMLSHILASTKKRIIVYCGGAHAATIKKFLCESAEFTSQFEEISSKRDFSGILLELDPGYLDLLGQPHAA